MIDSDMRDKVQNVTNLMEKVKALYSPESRSYKARLLVTSLVTGSVLLTICIYGPYEMYINTPRQFPFTANDLLWTMGIFSTVCLIIVAPLAALLTGRLFDSFAGLVFVLSVGFYVQGNLLNLDLGRLDGSPVKWDKYTSHAMGNLTIWCVFFLIVLLLYYFNKTIWMIIVKLVSFLLITMQLITAIITSSPDKQAINHTSDLVLSTSNQFQLSQGSNIVVLSLDAFGGNLIDELLEVYPDALDAYSDFTFFRNYSTTIAGTFPSLNTMLTGFDFDPNLTVDEFFEKSWSSPSTTALFNYLKDNDYERNLFIRTGYAVGDLTNLISVADNLVSGIEEISYTTLIQKMLRLSCYRYTPHAIKPSFWLHTGEMSEIVLAKKEEGLWQDFINDDNYTFYQDLVNHKINTKNTGNTFVFYHLSGAHGPFSIDEEVNLATTDIIKQARGVLHICEEYILQMKELGIYEDSTIIITSDHDHEGLHPSTLLMIKHPDEKHTETAINQAPVSTLDFQPTLMQLAGMDHTPYGRSVYDIHENVSRLRTWGIWVNDSNYYSKSERKHNVLYEYDFDGHIDDVLVFDEDDILIPTRIVEVQDSVYFLR